MPILIGVAVLVLVVLVINGLHELTERRRRASLHRQAEAMGFGYAEEGDSSLLALPEDFLLFAQGVSTGPKNAMQRPRTPPSDNGPLAPELTVFEYTFNVKFGRYMQSWRQTVVRVSSDGLSLPSFSVMPQRVFDALATRARAPELREKILGSPPVKLPAYPSFADRTHIQGYDRLAVQALFDDALVALFDNDPLLCLEAGGSTLVLYTFDKVAQAEELPAIVAQANEAFGLLQTKASPTP
jgi:hypothetical protein